MIGRGSIAPSTTGIYVGGEFTTAGGKASYRIGRWILTFTVTSPNGGESWQAGSTQNITWTSQGAVGDVKIEYSTNNGSSWTTVAASTANDGTHPWTIPNTPSATCLVRVSETDGSPTDVSNAVFSILPTSGIVVTSPNGGESWEVGSAHNITWTSAGAVGNVMIDYSTNNGSTWTIGHRLDGQ